MAAGVDIYRATLVCSAQEGGTVPCNNVLWFREITDQGGVGDANLAADLAVAARWSGLRALQGTPFKYDQVIVQRMWPTHDAPVHVFFPAGTAGTAVANILPPICSFVCRIYGISPGRSHQGRIFWTGFHTGASDGASWQAGTGTAFVSWFQAFTLRYSGLVGGGNQFAFGVWSPKLGGGRPPTSGAGFSVLNNFVPDGVVRLQRSRELGVSRRHAGHH